MLVGVLFALSFDALGLAALFAASSAALGGAALAAMLALVFVNYHALLKLFNNALVERRESRREQSAYFRSGIAVLSISPDRPELGPVGGNVPVTIQFIGMSCGWGKMVSIAEQR